MAEEEVTAGGYYEESGWKPINCKAGNKSLESEPYVAAKTFIKKNPKRHCCNVGMDGSVQRWVVPEGVPRVLLERAASDTTFVYNYKLDR